MCSIFSSRSFIVSSFTFRFLIHFEFTFAYGVRKYSTFIHLHVTVQYSQCHLLKRPSLLHYIILPSLSQVNYRCMDLFLSFLSCSITLYFFFCVCVYANTVLLIQLMTVSLQYCLKPEYLIPPAPIFFLRIALAIWALLCLNANSRIFFSTSVKNAIGSLIKIAVNLQTALNRWACPFDNKIV